MANQQAQEAKQTASQSPQKGQQREGKQQGLAPKGSSAVEASDPWRGNPFSLMQRFSEDVDRLFGSFFGKSPLGRSAWFRETATWPNLEVSRTDDKLIVQADLPGMKKDDIQVEVRDSELCISGERRSESEQKEGGYVRSERSYGSFCRTVHLPEGAKVDTAAASFGDGVLRIEIETPGAAPGGRRIEVRSASPQ